jgi:hypothetical protein
MVIIDCEMKVARDTSPCSHANYSSLIHIYIRGILFFSKTHHITLKLPYHMLHNSKEHLLTFTCILHNCILKKVIEISLKVQGPYVHMKYTREVRYLYFT